MSRDRLRRSLYSTGPVELSERRAAPAQLVFISSSRSPADSEDDGRRIAGDPGTSLVAGPAVPRNARGRRLVSSARLVDGEGSVDDIAANGEAGQSETRQFWCRLTCPRQAGALAMRLAASVVPAPRHHRLSDRLAGHVSALDGGKGRRARRQQHAGRRCRRRAAPVHDIDADGIERHCPQIPVGTLHLCSGSAVTPRSSALRVADTIGVRRRTGPHRRPQRRTSPPRMRLTVTMTIPFRHGNDTNRFKLRDPARYHSPGHVLDPVRECGEDVRLRD